MLEIAMLTIVTVVLALFWQARRLSRAIRQTRDQTQDLALRDLTLYRRPET